MTAAMLRMTSASIPKRVVLCLGLHTRHLMLMKFRSKSATIVLGDACELSSDVKTVPQAAFASYVQDAVLPLYQADP